MSISGVNEYSSILQNYKVPSVPVHNPIVISDVQQQEVDLPVGIHEEPSAMSVERHDAKIEDISITFNQREEFDYIGQDRDIRLLDMERAISDMKKDQVLQQYQYFVGSAKNLMANNSDGAVFAKF